MTGARRRLSISRNGSSSVPAARLRRFGPAALLALLALLFLSPAIFTSKVLLPADSLLVQFPWASGQPSYTPKNLMVSDAIEQFYPYHCFLRSEALQGRLPLWNPYLLGGTPFVATTVSGAFSLIRWLLLILPPAVFFEWSAFLKLALAGIGIYAYCRYIGLSRLGAFFSGVSYTYAGYGVYLLLFPNTEVWCWFGWGLLALEDYLSQRRIRSLALFSLIIGVSILGGHVESAALQMVGYSLYAALREWRRVAQVIAAQVLGVALGAVMLVPFLAFLFDSATLAARSQAGRNPYFLDLERWRTLFIPYIYGSPIKGADITPQVPEGFAYIGIIPFAVALCALASPALRRHAYAITAFGLFNACILFGIPVVFDLFTSLPLLRQGNHYHSAQIVQASVALLAGMGFDQIRSGTQGKRSLYFALSAGAAVVVLACLPQLVGWASGKETSFFFVKGRYPIPCYSIWVLVCFAAVAGAAQAPRLSWALIAASIANIFLFGFFFNPSISPATTLDLKPPVVQTLRLQKHERFVVLGVAAMAPNFPMSLGLRDVRGYESVVLDRIPPFYQALTKGSTDAHYFIPQLDDKNLPLLERAGCSLVLSPVALPQRNLELIQLDSAFLYRIKGGGRAVLADEVEARVSGGEILRQILSNPRSPTLLETSGPVEQGGGKGEIRWLDDRPDFIRLAVDGERGNWLVLRDTCAPGWRARIDGADRPVVRADSLFRAVWVPPGRHVVEFRYRPASFTVGCLVSALSLVVLAILFVWKGEWWTMLRAWWTRQRSALTD